ncbi:MAG: diguanylate cyclase [Ruminococcus bicirculans]|nr:diguanylate cyclase [Ruminococcus bicirculans (ex Wegman et al. 2014)]MBS6819541.1 diguanylate cyclase [Ruminococcus bicirculans (ex Wegman et al. 2014)]
MRTVSNVVQSITSNDEICVRTGGDEFCLIGIGKYADDEPQRRTERFLKTLEAVGRSSDKPYEITASIGWASAPYSENVVSELLNTADERMYENKLMRKKKRI